MEMRSGDTAYAANYGLNLFLFPQKNVLFKMYIEIIHPTSLHCWASRHSQGFEDKNLGSSPGLLGQ